MPHTVSWQASERRARNAVVRAMAKYTGLPTTRIGDDGVAGSEFRVILTDINTRLGHPADDFKGLSAESTTHDIIRFFARALGSARARPRRSRRTTKRM